MFHIFIAFSTFSWAFYIGPFNVNSGEVTYSSPVLQGEGFMCTYNTAAPNDYMCYNSAATYVHVALKFMNRIMSTQLYLVEDVICANIMFDKWIWV